eukprot:CAMPEP_0176501884 /NCGR_PEP_ID=MMETSP0200_2-20121128/14437_1 /TAXON_ID=947934 /ORGANISM="Chaetoceros sp., Strain GSL56" /LENGTH=502 /DNA_ID=CAMNT_0017900877 /DNA_START=173 /DNA_END=1681 /DNA_ORIENTATION=+
MASSSIGRKKKNSGYTFDEPMHPNYGIDSVKPPKYWAKPDVAEDPMAYKRKPVSSVHAIDSSLNPPKLSTLDSATVSPNGTVVHGRFGELELDPSAGIPLEYLSLLYPAAQGAAALRTIANGAKSGTVLVYGAGHAAALATLQLASADGLAVVGVVSGDQSGNDEFVDAVKCMTVEPGTVVPEEFAVLKANFREVVDAVVRGQDAEDKFDPEEFLMDFQKNLLEYSKFFPETALSPVPEDYTFSGKEKDRKYFDDNISAYLSQFQKGSPAFDEVILKEAFTKEQYEIFKSKFGKQLTAVITGDDNDVVTDFNPADIVKKMTESPEIISDYLKNQSHTLDGENGEFIPYEFSILKNQITKNVDLPQGGPVLGAVLNVTSDLAVAVETVSKGKTLRDKAEALQFLTESQKNAYAAASSIVSIAKENGKPVVVVGGKLPGFDTVEPSNEDVQEALSAMKLEEDGSSRLNYFIQVYRASDYAVYADYAIHRSQEELSGPRQFVVTK